MKTPRELGFRQPAEWEPHTTYWLAWPHLREEWGPEFESARQEVAALCEALADQNPRESNHPAVSLVVFGAEGRRSAEEEMGARIALREMPYGDIWLRDTGPVFLTHRSGSVAASCFRFNGWGSKFLFEHDPQVAERIAKLADVPVFRSPLVLEGGAVESDGHGTLITTRQCLLADNRNPDLNASAVETHLRAALGADKVVWLDEGLANDHTDGHVDNLARFVAPGVVVCMEPRDSDDPNRTVLDQIHTALRRSSDAQSRPLEVVVVPSPGRVAGRDGRPLPASYLNFVIDDRRVVVPTFESGWDDEAVQRIGALFPSRSTMGLSARALLTGGGAFHCITQPQPYAPSP